MTRRISKPSALPPLTPDAAAAAAKFLEGQEITTTQCRGCGSDVSGVNGRYACGVCSWVNHWSEGNTALPSAEADPQA